MYSLKTTYNIKSRLHSRQQPCHSPRQTVIGLRNLFSKRLLAIPYSAVLQKISIFETTALVRVSAHVYTQVCFVNLELNWARHFSVQFKLGLSGSAAVPPIRQVLSLTIRCRERGSSPFQRALSSPEIPIQKIEFVLY